MKRFLALVVLVGCSSGGGGAPQQFDAGRTRRVIEPPSGVARAVPPHAIDPGGVGPYRLGATQAEIFEALHSIPRVAILDVEKVLDASVVRTEDDTVLVGGPPGERIDFIAVLAPNIAKTDEGVGVGSTVAEVKALGEEREVARAEHDPRIVVPEKIPAARFLVENEKVSAILLMKAQAGGGEKGCAAALPASEAVLKGLAGVEGRVKPACLTEKAKEAVVAGGNVVAVVDATRKLASIEIPGLVWAAPIHSGDDRDEIVAVSEKREGGQLVETLVVLRWEGKLVRVAEEKVYELTENNAQWIGARLDDVRLLLTVEARGEGFVVGGVLMRGGADGVRDVAPLLPRPVQRRRRGPASTPQVTPDAAVRDAGVHDAG